MDWLATIDVPAMTLSQAVDKEIEGSVLADVLMALKDCKVKVLFRNELYNSIYWECRELRNALSFLATTDIIEYECQAKADFIKSNPDLVKGVGIKEEENEIRYQLYNLHTENKKTSKVYLVSRFKPTTNILCTTLDKKTEDNSLLFFQNSRDIMSFMSANRPKLVQQKHNNSEYILGGNTVSPFSAYDPNDESAAKALLSQAFDEYQDAIQPNNPPNSLFTRDLANRTYVCFRHSGNWEYHGYDTPATDSNLPDYIKRKYNIWK